MTRTPIPCASDTLTMRLALLHLGLHSASTFSIMQPANSPPRPHNSEAQSWTKSPFSSTVLRLQTSRIGAEWGWGVGALHMDAFTDGWFSLGASGSDSCDPKSTTPHTLLSQAGTTRCCFQLHCASQGVQVGIWQGTPAASTPCQGYRIIRWMSDSSSWSYRITHPVGWLTNQLDFKLGMVHPVANKIWQTQASHVAPDLFCTFCLHSLLLTDSFIPARCSPVASLAAALQAMRQHYRGPLVLLRPAHADTPLLQRSLSILQSHKLSIAISTCFQLQLGQWAVGL